MPSSGSTTTELKAKLTAALEPEGAEIYADRLRITSYGGLVAGLSREECLAGRSMPRNRVLMRIFRDLELMEQLGSGMHRILSIYDSSVFKISEHFFEICFPFERQEGEEWLEVGTDPVTPQVEHLLAIQNGDMSLLEMQELLQLKDRKSFTQLYLHPAMEKGWMEMTIPDKPNSRLQKYRLTEAGRQLQAQLREGSP